MSADWVWWTAAVALTILEAFVGTFHLLVLALACVLGGAMAYFGFPGALQWIPAAGAAVVGWLIRARLMPRDLAHGVVLAAHPNQLIEIGATVHVGAWRSDRTTRVSSRGREWEALLREDQAWPAAPGAYLIAGVNNARVILIPPPRRGPKHPAAR